MHAKDYKTADIFEGKRVLVVGMGNTGCDIVVDAIHRAKQVLWSVRGGNHFVPKFLAGKPADEGNHKPKRFIIPKRLRSMLHEPILRFVVGPPERFGLPKPEHRLYDRTPIVNSLVLQHLGQGDVVLRKPIKEFRGNTVVFTDGQRRRGRSRAARDRLRDHVSVSGRSDRTELAAGTGRAAALSQHLSVTAETASIVAGLLEGAGVGWPGRALQTDLIAAYIKAQKENPDGRAEFRDRDRCLSRAAPWPRIAASTVFSSISCNTNVIFRKPSRA